MIGHHAHTAPTGPLPAVDHRENAQGSAVTTILHQLLGVIQKKEGEGGRRVKGEGG